jgi:hypothetical protein
MSTQAAISDADIFMFDPDAETMPREALSALQTARLRTETSNSQMSL